MQSILQILIARLWIHSGCEERCIKQVVFSDVWFADFGTEHTQLMLNLRFRMEQDAPSQNHVH